MVPQFETILIHVYTKNRDDKNAWKGDFFKW